MSITKLAGAAQTWPEFSIELVEDHGNVIIRYGIRVASNDAWITVDRETYLAALATSSVSTSQDIATLLGSLFDRLNAAGKL